MKSLTFAFTVRILPVLLSLFLLGGCAVVNTGVSRHSAAEVRALRQIDKTGMPAGQWLEYARSLRLRPAGERLGAWLATAQAARPGALAGDETCERIYQAALRQILAEMEKSDWKLEPSPQTGGFGKIEIAASTDTLLDPRSATRIIPADQIHFSGLPHRVSQKGFGLACVAVLPRDATELAEEPGIPRPGLTMPVTAVVSFSRPGGAAEPAVARIEFIRTLRKDELPEKGKAISLAKDSSASLAWLISTGPNRALDVVTLFFPRPELREVGLIQLEPYDPDRIPVVFVHGLLSRPETWRNAINTLQADPVIRKNYQFWLFSYPTGWPVWVSAARLRSELDRFNEVLGPRANTPARQKRLNSKILVGHSMGGLISNLQIRRGGDLLWSQFSKTPLDELRVPDSAKKSIREAVDFSPRTDVSRVIFVAAPHRGSPTALSLPAQWVASNIRFLVRDVQNVRQILLGEIESELRREFSRPLNSIRFLEANSPLLQSILELPRNERVAMHSIMGDRGRGDGEKSSDGIVPYWSSHMPGVKSTKFVPSGHGAHEHPEGIEEIARILREAAPSQKNR